MSDRAGGKEVRHHRDVHRPEAVLAAPVVEDLDPLDPGHREVEGRQVQQGVRAEEGQVPVGHGDLGAVRVVVDLRQRVCESPHAGADEVEHRAADGVRPGEGVDDLLLPLLHVVHRVEDHQEDRKRQATQPCADIVTDDDRDERHEGDGHR